MIYFLQPTEGGPVLIGSAEDLGGRLRQLEAYFGRTLALLATIPGGLAVECELHIRFAHLRIPSDGPRLRMFEQYRPARDLMVLIGLPLLGNPVPARPLVRAGQFRVFPPGP